MAFNHTGEYLVVGSDTETVHIFRCSTAAAAAAAAAKGPGGVGVTRTWSGGASSQSTESPVDDDMERVIEQKRRNGSMGYRIPPVMVLMWVDKRYGRDHSR